MVKELAAQGAKVTATCRHSSDELKAALEGDEEHQIITGADVTKEDEMKRMAEAVAAPALDLVINNAGYFYGPVETLDSLNFEEEKKMLDICALGPLRVTAALRTAGKLR